MPRDLSQGGTPPPDAIRSLLQHPRGAWAGARLSALGRGARSQGGEVGDVSQSREQAPARKLTEAPKRAIEALRARSFKSLEASQVIARHAVDNAEVGDSDTAGFRCFFLKCCCC